MAQKHIDDNQVDKFDGHRMVEWLMFALTLYGLACLLLVQHQAGPIQTALWKMANLTMGAYVGYWIDRAAFRDRVTKNTEPMVMLRRAIVVTGAMYTLAVGL